MSINAEWLQYATYDGTTYEPGDPIVLSDSEFARLSAGHYVRAAAAYSIRPAGPVGLLTGASLRPVAALLLGSSSTSGVGATTEEDRYVNQLARALTAACPSNVWAYTPPVRTLAAAAAAPPTVPGVHVVNGGVGGTTSASYVTSGMLAQIATLQPRVVVHMIGANDYALNVQTRTYQANLLEHIAEIDAVCTIRPWHIVASTYARPDVTAPLAPWSEYVAAMITAASAAGARYADLWTPFVDLGASGPDAVDPFGLVATDRIHPSDAGHRALAGGLASAFGLPPAAAVSPPELRDRFARPVLGNAESGQPWEQQTGVFAPTGTGLSVTTGGTLVADTGFSDAEVSALVTHQSAVVPGLVAKSGDSSTRIGGFLNGPNDRVELYQGTSPVATSPALGLVSGREYELRLMVKGNLARLWLDGTPMLSFTLSGPDATTYSGFTKHGVRCSVANAGVRWRNLSVRRL